jgi:hypothetical protein
MILINSLFKFSRKRGFIFPRILLNEKLGHVTKFACDNIRGNGSH